MAHRTCDGAGLLGAFRAAVANLEAHVEEVNALIREFVDARGLR